MIDTILFDLDGTLLSIDINHFIKVYFDKLSSKFVDYFNKDEFINYIWRATEYMINNKNADMTNMQSFCYQFQKLCKYDISELMPIFDNFYKNEFYSLGYITKPNPSVIKTINILKDKGYILVVATNPIFPYSAMKDRIRWAGLDPNQFSMVTSYENMHYCKPHVEYYQELLDKIKKKPYQCIMVGNDVQEDIVAAGSLGIKTFLVKDFEINRTGQHPPADFYGGYDNLLEFANDIPVLIE